MQLLFYYLKILFIYFEHFCYIISTNFKCKTHINSVDFNFVHFVQFCPVSCILDFLQISGKNDNPTIFLSLFSINDKLFKWILLYQLSNILLVNSLVKFSYGFFIIMCRLSDDLKNYCIYNKHCNYLMILLPTEMIIGNNLLLLIYINPSPFFFQKGKNSI